MKKQLAIIPVFIISLFSPLYSIADEAPVNVSFGASVQPARWKGENLNGGTDFETTSSQLQLNLRIRKEKIYGGLSFQGAEFEFKDGAPNKVNENVSVRDDDATIKRGEFDLVFGYYFWPKVSLFIDLKSITNDWKNDGYAVRYNGMGFGVSGYQPINADWVMFGSIGFVNLDIRADSKSIGDGKGSALVIGALYRINQQVNFTVSLKSQHNEYDFDEGSEQEHDIGGLVLGFSYSI